MDSEPRAEASALAPAGAAEAIETAAELMADEGQSRLWLRAIIPLLQIRSHETDPSDRVQFAFDLMHVAACERIARILRADLGP